MPYEVSNLEADISILSKQSSPKQADAIEGTGVFLRRHVPHRRGSRSWAIRKQIMRPLWFLPSERVNEAAGGTLCQLNEYETN